MKKSIDTNRKEFLHYLDNMRGYSDLTIKSYDESLKEAFKYIEIFEDDEYMTFDLMPYRIKIASLNSKTISKKLSAIRSFVIYLNDNNVSTILKADDNIKVAKTLPKPISHESIMEALSYSEE